jgi:hypothetical protein
MSISELIALLLHQGKTYSFVGRVAHQLVEARFPDYTLAADDARASVPEHAH